MDWNRSHRSQQIHKPLMKQNKKIPPKLLPTVQSTTEQINKFLENWIRKPKPYVLGQEKDTGRIIMSNEDTSDVVWTTTKGTGGFTVKVKDHELRWMKENNKTWMDLQMSKWNPSPDAIKAQQDYFALPIDYSYAHAKHGSKWSRRDLLGIKKPYWKW